MCVCFGNRTTAEAAQNNYLEERQDPMNGDGLVENWASRTHESDNEDIDVTITE